MMAHAVDFWTLVRYDMARSRLEYCREDCERECAGAVQDIAATVLRIDDARPADRRLSEGTRGDLEKIAKAYDRDLEFFLTVLDACVEDESDPEFLEAVRRDCPHSYEYYRLWRHGLLSLV